MNIIHGDKITALGLSFTVDSIIYQGYFGDRAARPAGSDNWGYDVEFKDRRGEYHHWKQNQDGGEVARWDGRGWKVYNHNGFVQD